MKALSFVLVLVAFSLMVGAQNSHIQVVAEPGISVFLDGIFKGKTTYDVGGLIIEKLNAGTYKLKVVKEGFTTQEESISIKDSEVLLYQVKPFTPQIRIRQQGNEDQQTIELKTGNLKIQSVPVGIRIRIQGTGIDSNKTKDEWYAEDIPVGNYPASIYWDRIVLKGTIIILENRQTELFVNLIGKDIDYLGEIATEYEKLGFDWIFDDLSPEEEARIMRIEQETAERVRREEEQRRLTQVSDRTRNAFGNKGNTGTTGQSEEIAGGEGNQGVATGTVGIRNYGPGIGTDNGTIYYSLGDRMFQSLPVPKNEYQVEGTVVVEISVDRSGSVTKAVAGVKGSTTLDDDLLKVARDAAMKAKFDSNNNAPLLQKGTITYIFKLK